MNAPRYLASILFKMAMSTHSSPQHIQHAMMLRFERTSEFESESQSTSESAPAHAASMWRWSKKPESIIQYVATTPRLDCTELFVVERCSHGGGDGIAFVMCDQDGAMCVLKRSNLAGIRDATASLQREVDMLLRAWPRRLSERVHVANWNSAPFLCMPLLRTVSQKDSMELGIDVEAAVRAHIDELASRGICHDDLHWGHVACYMKNEQPRARIVFIDWARSRIDMEEHVARSTMLSALELK